MSVTEATAPQYLVDANGERTAVVLPIAEWERLLEELEDAADIEAYLQAKQEPLESVSLAELKEEIRCSREAGCTK